MELLVRPRGKPPLRMVVVHGDAFSPRDRNREIGKALDLLFQGTKEKVRVLAGDLNLDLDLDKRRDLFSSDAYLDVETYNTVVTKMTDLGQGTGATAEPDRRLDYLFLSPAPREVLSVGPWKDQRVGDMDHDPLVADVVLR